MSEVGILCNDIDALRERCFVSAGLTILGDQEATEQGYYATRNAEVIVPIAKPQPATNAELASIMAGPETKRLMQLCRLPKDIGELLLTSGNTSGYKFFLDKTPYQEIAPGIVGLLGDSHLAEADQLTVSVAGISINPVTGLPPKVGFHMDTWANANITYLIGNAGPGERWHCFVPEFSRTAADGVTRSSRAAFLRSHPSPEDILVYWLKLQAPGPDHMEVILNAPTAEFLHEGSTLGFMQPSTAILGRINPVEAGRYPSPLFRTQQ